MPDSVVQGRAVPSPRHTLEDVPRRTIEDLTALYQLHPKLADFYVEGRTDRLFLEYLFEEADAKVIEIEEVEMPYDALQTRGLTEGNRQRVITLAANLHDAFIDEGLVSTRCIIDADFDRALGRDSGDNRFLRRTDYSCVESYWFDRYHLDKYIRFGLRQVQGLADRDISADLSPVLRSLFVLRAAGMAIRKDLTWLSPIRSLDWTEERIVFDRLRFVERWLNKNSAIEVREELLATAEHLDRELPRDARHTIHGHDFVEVLSWYVRKFVNNTSQLARPEVVERMLACCCDREVMSRHPLIQELLELAG